MKKIKIILLFFIVLIVSYLIRDIAYHREANKIIKDISVGIPTERDVDFVPFLIESSMMYSYALNVKDGKGIPKFDDKLVGMSNVSVNRQFTTGLEYVLGYSYRFKNYLQLLWGKNSKPTLINSISEELSNSGNESHSSTKNQDNISNGVNSHFFTDIKQSNFEDDPEFANWCRIQVRIWAAIVSGLIFLWLIALRIPLFYSFFGGLLHGVSSAALARYTGQDIVRGNFTLPLIIATFMIAYYYFRKPKKWKLPLFFIIAFLAITTWDMTQICFAIWGISEIVRLVMLNNVSISKKRLYIWISLFLAVVLASIVIPYHRAHMLIASPLVMVVFPLIFSLNYFYKRELKQRIFILISSVFIFFTIWFLVASLSSFSDSYNHFGSLMMAKIKFLNIKPVNPDLLNFDSRSIWVPGMHSVNRYIILSFFPILFYFTIFILFLSLTTKTIRTSFFKKMPLLNFPLFMVLFYGVGFVFIVRYHVFLIIFISILLPIILSIWSKNSSKLSFKDLLHSIFFAIIFFTGTLLFKYNSINLKVTFISFSYVTVTILILIIVTFMIIGIKKIFFNLLKRFYPSKVLSRSSNNRTFVTSFVQILLIVVAIFILIKEVDQSIEHRRESQRNYFAESAALIKWLRQENMENEIFMADFTLSPMLKAYCNTKIVLQPKFELGETRKIYRLFMNTMFHKTEKELAELCKKQNAKFFIFDKGYPYSKGPFSPRYIAAAHELKSDSPANMMNTPQNRGRLNYFYEIKPPNDLRILRNRYILFKVITDIDKKRAEIWLRAAKKELKNKNINLAARLVRSAYFADPLSPKIYLMYKRFYRRVPPIRLRGY